MPPMEKSPDAFRTISEVADVLDTPAHVLRFWESRFPQIRPVKRAGGRRYYRPADVALLAGIKRLLHDEGMTIRGVQKILREQGVRHVAGASEGPVVDAYDILGLAEAVAQADRADAATKVIDLSTRVRASGSIDETNGAGWEKSVNAGDAAGPRVQVAAPGALAGIEDAVVVAEDAGDVEGAWSHAQPSVSEEPAHLGGEPGADPLAESAPDVLPQPVETAAFAESDDVAGQPTTAGWLPTRLRALAPGALDGPAALIVPLAMRLSDLRDRMAQPARSGRG